MTIHWARQVSDDWEAVREELERAFAVSREAARSETSLVYVVRHDDLLGRNGSGNAMVAAGLLSAARTAAIEGSRKGWTANVVAYQSDIAEDSVTSWAEHLAGSSAVSGELIRIGTGHLGKALP